jgi:hypothetical protein
MFLPSTLTLQLGDSGEFVAELQRRLHLIQLYPENAIHGQFDGVTANAVMQFQAMQGLKADGIAGPATIRRLNAVITGTTETESSGGSGSQEEEAEKKRIADQQAMDMLRGNLSPQDPVVSMQTAAEEKKPEAAREEVKPVAVELKPITEAPTPPAREAATPKDTTLDLLKHQEALHAQAHAAPVITAAPVPSLSDMLAQALQQPQAHAAATAAEKPPAIPPTPVALQEPPPIMQTQQQPLAPSNEQRAAAAQLAESVARNPLLQRLVEYIEARLPPSVIKEVLTAGLAMVQHGVREAPIPADATLRAPDATVARGPEQLTQRGA